MKIEGFIQCIKMQALIALISETRTREWAHLGRVLIICPHPDDEILGLGGTILTLNENGCQIHIIFLTDGEASGVWHDLEEIRRQRTFLSDKIIKNLGLATSNIYRMHLPDSSIPHHGQGGFVEAVLHVREIINTVNPDAVFATHPLDYWPFDHVACSQIASVAVQQSEHKPQLWYYWVWAWYNVRPWKLTFNSLKKLRKIDISDHLGQKKELINIYLKPMTPNGKPWSGILPKSLLRAFNCPFEVIERII